VEDDSLVMIVEEDEFSTSFRIHVLEARAVTELVARHTVCKALTEGC
jgi:hypothetical protein